MFDRGDGRETVMERVEHNNALSTVSSSSANVWSIDFVRGAAMASGAEEIILNHQVVPFLLGLQIT
jgi:hypothetical protein